MADIKGTGFMLLVLLISVSAVYEFTLSEDEDGNKNFPALSDVLGVGEMEGYKSATFSSLIRSFQIKTEATVETTAKSDPIAFVVAAINIGIDAAAMLLGLVFGWTLLLNSIFATLNLQSLSIVFIPGIAFIEILTIIYFIIDLKKTLPFIGG